MLFRSHLRNVDAPLPHFVETFLDNGYGDMRQVMLALQAVNYNGIVILDHIPQILNNHQISAAYTIGYMQALLASVTATLAAAPQPA